MALLRKDVWKLALTLTMLRCLVPAPQSSCVQHHSTWRAQGCVPWPWTSQCPGANLAVLCGSLDGAMKGGKKKEKRQECVGRPLLYLPCPVPLFRWAVSSLFLYTTWGVLREQVPGLMPSWSCSSFQHTVIAPYSSSGADCGIQGTEDVERIQD